jgi:hypothetical protein
MRKKMSPKENERYVPEGTERLMAALVRQPPKQHKEMKLGTRGPVKRTAGKGRARVGKAKA